MIMCKMRCMCVSVLFVTIKINIAPLYNTSCNVLKNSNNNYAVQIVVTQERTIINKHTIQVKNKIEIT